MIFTQKKEGKEETSRVGAEWKREAQERRRGQRRQLGEERGRRRRAEPQDGQRTARGESE